jgi:hypothetical protein
MRQGDTVDSLIQTAVRAGVQTEEPSTHVRDSLLTSAANHSTPYSVLGPSIPAIASGLQDCNKRAAELDEQVVTSISLGHRQLLLLAAPLYAVR